MITVPHGPQLAGLPNAATELSIVLRYIRAHMPCSRTEIAAATGLSHSTVSSLVASLTQLRLLRQTGFTGHGAGGPPDTLVFDGSSYAAIGLEANDNLTVVAVDLAGKRILSWRRSFPGPDSTPGQAATAIAALSRRAVSLLGKQGRRVLGLTIGVPGLAPHLQWCEPGLRDRLTHALGAPDYPVTVENDANLAVLAESRYGEFAGTKNLIYLTGEVGIRAGIITGGRLIDGATGFPGEVGHLQVEPDGPACRCGRTGCLEAVAGISAVVANALPDSAIDGAATYLEPGVAEVARRARTQDPTALKALTETGHALGHAVSILANLLDPEVVILGGYFVPLTPWLLPAAEAELRARCVSAPGTRRIVASTLGFGAAATGAVTTILDHVDAGNLPNP